jgi:hypothetical protein
MLPAGHVQHNTEHSFNFHMPSAGFVHYNTEYSLSYLVQAVGSVHNKIKYSFTPVSQQWDRFSSRIAAVGPVAVS